jgi:N-acetylneuraminate synthase/sialic acid synthase
VREFNKQIAILQCTSTYPCPFEDINLNVLPVYRNEYKDCVIGYSGHELGIAVPVAAVALGARIIERHYTLDRTMKGGDHAASLEPEGLRKMVRDIRAIEKALGTGQKKIMKGEDKVQQKLAKSVVAAVGIPKGTKITRDMLCCKSPGDGIPPFEIEKLIGKTVSSDIPVDTLIRWEQLA